MRAAPWRVCGCGPVSRLRPVGARAPARHLELIGTTLALGPVRAAGAWQSRAWRGASAVQLVRRHNRGAAVAHTFGQISAPDKAGRLACPCCFVSGRPWPTAACYQLVSTGRQQRPPRLHIWVLRNAGPDDKYSRSSDAPPPPEHPSVTGGGVALFAQHYQPTHKAARQ